VDSAKCYIYLESWYAGIQAGNAIADVLFGDYNPDGKLPVTFPRNVGQVPIYYNHKNTGDHLTDGAGSLRIISIWKTHRFIHSVTV